MKKKEIRFRNKNTGKFVWELPDDVSELIDKVPGKSAEEVLGGVDILLRAYLSLINACLLSPSLQNYVFTKISLSLAKLAEEIQEIINGEPEISPISNKTH